MKEPMLHVLLNVYMPLVLLYSSILSVWDKAGDSFIARQVIHSYLPARISDSYV